MIDKKIVEERFYWIYTRIIVYELERGTVTIPKSEIGKIDRLITFHENLENFEICRKLLTYKEKCLNSNII